MFPHRNPATAYPARSDRYVFCIVGLLLVASAIAKLWLLVTDAFADVRIQLPIEILWVSVAFELVLGMENFRVRNQKILALIDLSVFSGFAVFSSVRMALGFRTCGCSGALELPSWLFTTLDVGIVVSLVSTPKKRRDVVSGIKELVAWWTSCDSARRGLVAGVLLSLVFVVSIQLPAVAPLRDLVLGKPPLQAVVEYQGEMVLNQKVTIHVDLCNHSFSDAKVVGVSRSCRCVHPLDDPSGKLIPFGDRTALPLSIVPDRTGPFHQRLILFVNHPKQFRLNVDVVGFVKGGG